MIVWIPFLCFSDISLDGLEPPMLDETWGLSNHTTIYSGKFSKYNSSDVKRSKDAMASQLAENHDVNGINDVNIGEILQQHGDEKEKENTLQAKGLVLRRDTIL